MKVKAKTTFHLSQLREWINQGKVKDLPDNYAKELIKAGLVEEAKGKRKK